MKHLKSFVEKSKKVEWTTYNHMDAEKYLEDAFVDFIHPTDNTPPAKIIITQGEKGRGYLPVDLMMEWIIEIPFKNRGDIKSFSNKLTSTLKEIEGCIEKASAVLNIGHNVVLSIQSIKIYIWSRDK